MSNRQGFTPHVLRKKNFSSPIEWRSRFADVRKVMNTRYMERAGFTLIELLVVVSIIGTLATLSVVSLNGARAKARDARRVSDVRQIQMAVELYYFDHDAYPAATATLGSGNYGCLGRDGFSSVGTACAAPYMGFIPSNPSPNGSPYAYESAGGSAYTLTFTLESGAGGLTPTLHTADQNGLF